MVDNAGPKTGTYLADLLRVASEPDVEWQDWRSCALTATHLLLMRVIELTRSVDDDDPSFHFDKHV